MGTTVLLAGWLMLVRRAGAAAARTEPRGEARSRGRGRRGQGVPPPGERTPQPPDLAWPALLGGAAIAGPVGGLLLGAAAYASSGALGGGRLAQVGPVAWQVAVLGSAVVTLGALVGVAAARSVRA